jgi:pyridinium-3,5-bisthiocarboxylic acid mononucleotide nickel chelatase
VSARPGTSARLHLHFEPTSGIAGDMAVAALVDLGVPISVVKGAVDAMGVRGLRVGFGRRKRGAYLGRSFEVTWPGQRSAGVHDHHAHGHGPARTHADDHNHDHAHEHEHEHEDHAHARANADGHARAGVRKPAWGRAHDHRDYAEVKRLLARARLDPDARALAADIFARIAEVEAALHGTRLDRVAFHEVGAYDSIADIVGVAAAISHLAPASIGSLPPVVGTGQVRTAHGPVPVPAPATLALLAEMPILTEGDGELTTPTGAAILAAVVDGFGPLPPMRVRAVGYGAGTRELPDRANVLRVVIGEPLGVVDAPAATQVVLLEGNLDDMSPQLVGPLHDALSAAGALDVWSAPILMKKGRPALQVSALVPPAALAVVERAFFENSTTLGLRRRALDRVVLARSFETVETPYGRIRVKLAALDGEILGAQPEFEDCRRLAARVRVPAREVLAAATAAARALLPPPRATLARRPRRHRP